MFSGSADTLLLARAIEAGCTGLISKDRPIDDIIDAVRAAAQGRSIVNIDEFTSLLTELRQANEPTANPLTPREMDVLRLVAQAHSTREIADELFLSVNTVRNYVSSILMKLGAHSKLEAVAFALRDGLLPKDTMG